MTYDEALRAYQAAGGQTFQPSMDIGYYEQAGPQPIALPDGRTAFADRDGTIRVAQRTPDGQYNAIQTWAPGANAPVETMERFEPGRNMRRSLTGAVAMGALPFAFGAGQALAAGSTTGAGATAAGVAAEEALLAQALSGTAGSTGWGAAGAGTTAAGFVGEGAASGIPAWDAAAATAAGATGASSFDLTRLIRPALAAAALTAAADGSGSSGIPTPPDMTPFLNDYRRMGEQFNLFSTQQAQLGAQMMGEFTRQTGLADRQFALQDQMLGISGSQLANQGQSLARQNEMMGLMQGQLANQNRMFGVMDSQLGLQGQQLGYQQNALGLQDRMMGQMDEQMALGRERFAALNPLSMQLTQGAADAQAQALNQGREQYDFWRNTYRPVEERLVNDAMTYNSEAARARMAQQAGADVEQALATQRGAGMRALERMGVNPNSGRMMELMSGSGLQAAKLRAGAENNARVQAEQIGFDRLSQAAQTGVRLPAQAIAALQASAQAANAGANTLGAADRIANLYTDNATRMGALGAQFGSQAVQFGGLGAQYGGNAISAGNSAANFGNVAQGFGNLGLGFGREAQGWGDQARGWANTAQSYGQLADSINRTGLQAANQANAFYRNQLSGMQSGVGTIDGSVRALNDQYAGQRSQYRDIQADRADTGRALASVIDLATRPDFRTNPYSYFARGGMVQGPGTGTSDDVEAMNEDNGQPIRLSNGEYVLPEKTVRAIGIDKLDKVVEKTNGKPPVHKQYDRRGQRKRALSR